MQQSKQTFETAALAAFRISAERAKQASMKPVTQNKGEPESNEIEFVINDLPMRAKLNILSRGIKNQEIFNLSGAYAVTKGRFMTPEEKTQRQAGDKPLYLHIKGPNRQSLVLAIQMIEKLVDEASVTEGVVGVEKVFIGMDHAPSSFCLCNRVFGKGGANLQYITGETGAVLTLRGRGSGFMEPGTYLESPEPLHIHIEHQQAEVLQAARILALNLLQTVQQEFQQFCSPMIAQPEIQLQGQMPQLPLMPVPSHQTQPQMLERSVDVPQTQPQMLQTPMYVPQTQPQMLERPVDVPQTQPQMYVPQTQHRPVDVPPPQTQPQMYVPQTQPQMYVPQTQHRPVGVPPPQTQPQMYAPQTQHRPVGVPPPQTQPQMYVPQTQHRPVGVPPPQTQPQMYAPQTQQRPVGVPPPQTQPQMYVPQTQHQPVGVPPPQTQPQMLSPPQTQHRPVGVPPPQIQPQMLPPPQLLETPKLFSVPPTNVNKSISNLFDLGNSTRFDEQAKTSVPMQNSKEKQSRWNIGKDEKVVSVLNQRFRWVKGTEPPPKQQQNPPSKARGPEDRRIAELRPVRQHLSQESSWYSREAEQTQPFYEESLEHKRDHKTWQDPYESPDEEIPPNRSRHRSVKGIDNHKDPTLPLCQSMSSYEISKIQSLEKFKKFKADVDRLSQQAREPLMPQNSKCKIKSINQKSRLSPPRSEKSRQKHFGRTRDETYCPNRSSLTNERSSQLPHKASSIKRPYEDKPSQKVSTRNRYTHDPYDDQMPSEDNQWRTETTETCRHEHNEEPQSYDTPSSQPPLSNAEEQNEEPQSNGSPSSQPPLLKAEDVRSYDDMVRFYRQYVSKRQARIDSNQGPSNNNSTATNEESDNPQSPGSASSHRLNGALNQKRKKGGKRHNRAMHNYLKTMFGEQFLYYLEKEKEKNLKKERIRQEMEDKGLKPEEMEKPTSSDESLDMNLWLPKKYKKRMHLEARLMAGDDWVGKAEYRRRKGLPPKKKNKKKKKDA